MQSCRHCGQKWGLKVPTVGRMVRQRWSSLSGAIFLCGTIVHLSKLWQNHLCCHMSISGSILLKTSPIHRGNKRSHHHQPSQMNLNGDHHTILIEPVITHQLFNSLRPPVFSWMLEAEQCREVVGQVKVQKHCPLFHENHYDGDDYHLWPWWVFFIMFSFLRDPHCYSAAVCGAAG